MEHCGGIAHKRYSGTVPLLRTDSGRLVTEGPVSMKDPVEVRGWKTW